MTRDDAFVELLTAGVEPEEAKILIDAMVRPPRPIRPREARSQPVSHQPLYGLINRPFSIVTGFRQLQASEASDTFDFNAWEGSVR